MPEYRDLAGNPVPNPRGEQAVADRVRQATQPMNTAVNCEECGGNFFFLVRAEQFSGGGYGSMEYRSLTASPVELRMCPCGAPLTPAPAYAPGARTVQTARDAFFQSLALAKALRERRSADKLADRIVQETASRIDLEALKTALEIRIKALEDRNAFVPEVSLVQALGVPQTPTVSKSQAKREKVQKNPEIK
jgi:hypothetical protein